ncbi:hypothetical protein D3C81_1342880 [compost metagenome]
MHDIRKQPALLMHAAHAAQARTGHGGAVVAVDAANNHLLVVLPLQRPVMADHAQHGVVAFRAGAGEEHMAHALRGDIGDRLGQLQRGRVGGLEEQVVVRQLLHLLAGDVGQLIAAIADRHAPQARHAVENLVAFAVPEVHALGRGDDARAFLGQLLDIAERGQVVVAAHRLPGKGLRILFTH